ncbi:uncharacterized protein FA14DRAFT_176843 [Meira miltonrushii]|uniref:Ubiquinone biosynthesis protein n=1 Tax=Meira miltonrushii TaxID=1280837 RepID=A0A316VMC3_9BASI|nr:uncharacterized protein FA14DRAFT_176843 [Meira miltonrushii]PWN37553.1 hypothetical protein FA14DRAFT_176843 [Meira miltonrushii]
MSNSTRIRQFITQAQPYIQQHGFTLRSIRAAITSGKITIDNEEELAVLFPNQIEISKQLLTQFDKEGLKVASSSLLPSESSHPDSEERNAGDRRAIEQVELLLAGKLLHSVPFREHIVDALAVLTAAKDRQAFSSIPTPLPIMQRAWQVTDEAIHMAKWKGRLGTDWYTHRTRLTNAFLMAELHLLSPDFQGDAHQSVHVLRRLARPHSVFGTQMIESASQWVNWGSRGWLGIFRSVGL